MQNKEISALARRQAPLHVHVHVRTQPNTVTLEICNGRVRAEFGNDTVNGSVALLYGNRDVSVVCSHSRSDTSLAETVTSFLSLVTDMCFLSYHYGFSNLRARKLRWMVVERKRRARGCSAYIVIVDLYSHGWLTTRKRKR